MKTMIYGTLITLGLLIATAIYAMWANQVPWQDEPGFWPRLKVYLTQNVARTAVDARFPELRTRQYPVAADALLETLIQQCRQLEWHIEKIDNESGQIHAIATSKWIGFKDDIHMTVEHADEGVSRLHIQSSSRIGRADYAANLGHIIKLQNGLSYQ